MSSGWILIRFTFVMLGQIFQQPLERLPWHVSHTVQHRVWIWTLKSFEFPLHAWSKHNTEEESVAQRDVCEHHSWCHRNLHYNVNRLLFCVHCLYMFIKMVAETWRTGLAATSTFPLLLQKGSYFNRASFFLHTGTPADTALDIR